MTTHLPRSGLQFLSWIESWMTFFSRKEINSLLNFTQSRHIIHHSIITQSRYIMTHYPPSNDGNLFQAVYSFISFAFSYSFPFHSISFHFHSTLTPSLTPSFTHSVTHSLSHSVTPSVTHSLSHSLSHSLTHSVTQSLSRSFIRSFVDSSSFLPVLMSIHAHPSSPTAPGPTGRWAPPVRWKRRWGGREDGLVSFGAQSGKETCFSVLTGSRSGGNPLWRTFAFCSIFDLCMYPLES